MHPKDRTSGARQRGSSPRPRHEGPRERLISRGAEALSAGELIALVLRTGYRAGDAHDVARGLLARCGGLDRLESAPACEMAAVPGVGPAKAASLVAAFELGRRCAASHLPEGAALRSPEDVFRHFAAGLRRLDHERFVVVLLDGRHRVLGEEVVSRGTLTASLVHPREVFRPALRASAAAVILVHNHPSGDPTPSAEDRSVTARLADAGEILGVRVLDHVVVAERGFVSLREEGALDFPAGVKVASAKGRGAS
ncbi:MAG: DNA repair protein RadC [Myxococcales bacterium]|nr:DNA repair protein RadC [Myxococcales bacterium]